MPSPSFASSPTILCCGATPDVLEVGRIRTTLHRLASADTNLQTIREAALALARALDSYDGPTDRPMDNAAVRAAAIEVAFLAEGQHTADVSRAFAAAREWLDPAQIASMQANVIATYSANMPAAKPTGRVTGTAKLLTDLTEAWVTAANAVATQNETTWLLAVPATALEQPGFQTAAKWSTLRHTLDERGLAACGNKKNWVLVTAPTVVVRHLSLTGIASASKLYATPMPDGCDPSVVARFVAGLWNPDVTGGDSIIFPDAVDAAVLLA